MTSYDRFRIWLEFDVPWKWVIILWFVGCAIFIATHQGGTTHKYTDDRDCRRGMSVTDDCDY